MEISIRDLLAKHKTPWIREANIRYTVAKTITELTGIEVGPEKIGHTEGRLVLNVPPVLKSAILLRLDELKKKLEEDGISVTRVR